MTSDSNWKLGFSLSLLTAFLWGLLPIALKVLLQVMDATTITWYRFLAAAVLLGAFLLHKRSFPRLHGLSGRGSLLFAVAVLGLCGNYLLYLLGLAKVPPSTAQMVIQLAPMFLLLGGMVFFHERFQPIQWGGFGILVLGLILFFNDRYEELGRGDGDYYLGVLIIVAAAIVWAAYALAQKRLLKVYESEQILGLIYIAAAILLMPMSDLDGLPSLDAVQWLVLVFCCLNTLVAYGAFAEAMVHWEASRVSAVLATTPLITLAFLWMAARWFPRFNFPEQLNHLSLVGACMVVAGSMAAALGSRKRKLPLADAVPPPE